jgi:hypothetical protein
MTKKYTLDDEYIPYSDFGGNRFDGLFGEASESLKNKNNEENIKKELQKNADNFKVIKEKLIHILVEHIVTRERKWVSKQSILLDGMAIAFYDADPRLTDPD